MLFIIINNLASCSNDTVHISYYDTGEIETLISLLPNDTTLYKYKKYYKNGIIAADGFTLPNGRAQGFRNEYFDDGDLKFVSYYENGNRVVPFENGEIADFTKRKAYIKFEGSEKKSFDSFSSVEINADSIPFRTYVDSVVDTWYIVTAHYVKENKFVKLKRNKDKENSYPYMLPLYSTSDSIYIEYRFTDSKGLVILGQTPFVSMLLEVVPMEEN